MNYYIKQRLFNVWRSSFFIKDDSGQDIYQVKSNLSFLSRLTIYDMDNKPLLKIKKRYFRLYPRFDICNPNNNELLLYVKAKFSVFVKKFKIVSQNSEFNNITIDGNIFAWDFEIKKDDNILVEISKKIFKIADSYCVSINDENNAIYYLAMIIILDSIHHRKR